MLTPYSRSNFVEKILTDATGHQYRVVFLVAIVDGEVRGRVVSVKPLAENVLALDGTVSDGTFSLPAWTDKEVISTPYVISVAPFVSPYFNTDLILTSQPTRAPSL